MIIEENDDGFQIEGEPCPTCESEHTVYNREFGFWKCEECSTVWGHDKDDPDYDEVDKADLPTIEEMAGILADKDEP